MQEKLSSPAAGEMISLSKLIKKSHYIPVDDHKKINVMIDPGLHKKLSEEVQAKQQDSDEQPLDPEAQFDHIKKKVMKEAEQQADALMQKAMEQVRELKQQAEQDIERWWEERRSEDEKLKAEAQEEGFAEGYELGRKQAEEHIKEQYQAFIEEGQALLQLAHQNKEQIIQEAEPFLLELSISIAEKIIQHQLTVSPEWMIELVKEALTRKREKGLITLCVSAEHYPYVQQFRDELSLVIDSQAELQILPDGKVQDHGCVIRSSFGNIDATVDTQLQEIKQALYQIAMQNGDDTDGHTAQN